MIRGFVCRPVGLLVGGEEEGSEGQWRSRIGLAPVHRPSVNSALMSRPCARGTDTALLTHKVRRVKGSTLSL